MTRPLHTPYASPQKPFTIAMAPLEPDGWLEPDDRRAADLARKAEIFRDADDAFAAEEGTEAAQEEVRARVAAWLAAHGHDAGLVASVPADAPPLLRAALMVQDDLVVMRRDASGWRLVAAALAFPSAWLLSEKFARPMDEIHSNVPGWAGPMGTRVGRIFDGLKPDYPVWRLNWSIQFGGELRRPKSKHALPPTPEETDPDTALVRVERQTLTKLPGSGDILFTIKVMLDPLAALAAHPEGDRLLAGLAEQLAGLDPDQLGYKGLTLVRDRLLARIGALAAMPAGGAHEGAALVAPALATDVR